MPLAPRAGAAHMSAVDPAAFATAFSLIFIAELPDKTALAIFLLSSRGRALPVLLGAFAAFLAQGLVALGLGALLARLPAAMVRYGAAAVFLAFGLVLLLRRQRETKEAPPPTGKLIAS